MTMKSITRLFTAAAFTLFVFNANAQLKTPAPSPLQTVTQAFGLGEIKVEYSRPGVKGRVIYGDLVPFGKMWRTGANASTKITVGDNVKMNGTAIAAGTYALYTIPNKTEWTVMLYKDLALGGSTEKYKTEDELIRFTLKPLKTNDRIETFTIAFNDMTNNSCNLDLIWENTRVSIPVTSDHDAEVMKQIDKLMPETADNRPYYSAANYFYENDKDLNKALAWVDKAIEMNPKGFWIVHLKAKIQMKLKDYKGAKASAEKSKATAMEEKNEDFVSLNDKLLAEIKKTSGM